jgi:F0F1-type ATP synthase membrane subunit a
VWVPLALAFPFWGGSVVYALSRINWQRFLTGFVAGGRYFNTFLFLALEMVTISFRVITLSVRLTLNILVSLICAKLLFSLTLGVLWLGRPLRMVLRGDFRALWYVVFMSASIGYYVFEWFIGLLQSWLFTFLVVSYYDEGQMELSKTVRGLKLRK